MRLRRLLAHRRLISRTARTLPALLSDAALLPTWLRSIFQRSETGTLCRHQEGSVPLSVLQSFSVRAELTRRVHEPGAAGIASRSLWLGTINVIRSGRRSLSRRHRPDALGLAGCSGSLRRCHWPLANRAKSVQDRNAGIARP